MESDYVLKQRAFHHNQPGIGARRLCELTSAVYVYEVFTTLGRNPAVTSKREIDHASQIAIMSDKKPIGADQPKRQCEECGSKDVICTHSYPTKRCGWTKKFRCESCGNTWKYFQTPPLLLAGMGIREPEQAVLRTFALVCICQNFDQVEGLTGQKLETIGGWLMRCVSDPKAWQQIAHSLVSSFHVRTAEIETLSKLLLEIAQGKGTFHALARRRAAALLKAKTERRRLSPAEHLRLRSEGGMITEPGQDTEVAYRQFVRLYEAPRLIPLTKQQQSARERLRQRVELIVGEPIVVTPLGEFYRRYDDPRVGKWIAEIKRFDLASGARILQQLSPVERIVLDNIRLPNQATHNLALLEGARGTKVGSPLQEKMTVSCLADGVGMELGMFIGCVKDLVHSLRERR